MENEKKSDALAASPFESLWTLLTVEINRVGMVRALEALRMVRDGGKGEAYGKVAAASGSLRITECPVDWKPRPAHSPFQVRGLGSLAAGVDHGADSPDVSAAVGEPGSPLCICGSVQIGVHHHKCPVASIPKQDGGK